MSADPLAAMRDYAGATVARVRRIFYEFQGVTNTDGGPLELEFTDGRYLLIDAGPDGEAVAITNQEWEDPFAEDRMTAENRRFVASAGKWTAVEVSTDPGFSGIVGATISEITPVMSSAGKAIGVVVAAQQCEVEALVEADDLYVQTRRR